MSVIAVVAPHPDDETLGCGGTLKRHTVDGDEVHWLIATEMTAEMGFDAKLITRRADEIKAVATHYGFAETHALGFPSMRLDTVPLAEMIAAIANVFHKINAVTIYLPSPSDAHSDHRRVFEACVPCLKSFRFPAIRQSFVYETLSETEWGLHPGQPAFTPNLYVDISNYLDAKLAAMRIFESEMGTFPFPRSEEAIRSRAAVHGTIAGCAAAEAFTILRQIR